MCLWLHRGQKPPCQYFDYGIIHGVGVGLLVLLGGGGGGCKASDWVERDFRTLGSANGSPSPHKHEVDCGLSEVTIWRETRSTVFGSSIIAIPSTLNIKMLGYQR